MKPQLFPGSLDHTATMSPINFGPAKLLAMVTGLAPPEKRPLLENLMRQYADRQIDRTEMHESMTSIAGEDVVLKGMRILVPGYDEMMGRQAEAPSASSTAPPTVPDDGVDGLRKGFLSGTRLGSDGAQSETEHHEAPREGKYVIHEVPGNGREVGPNQMKNKWRHAEHAEHPSRLQCHVAHARAERSARLLSRCEADGGRRRVRLLCGGSQ